MSRILIVKEVTDTFKQRYQVSDLLFQMHFEEEEMILRSDPSKIKQADPVLSPQKCNQRNGLRLHQSQHK